jgi:uncharacterized damage-inducible protein DinB
LKGNKIIPEEKMTDKNIFKLLVKYNKEVNEKMNKIIETLSKEEWDKQFSGYYKSIHELCSHIFGGDRRWLLRFITLGEFKSITGSIFNEEHQTNKLLFENIGEYTAERILMDEILIDFVNELSEEDLNREMKWVNSKGKECIHTLGTGLLHLSHHQTHHRGMISLYLEFLGKENDYSNLYPYE